MVIRLIEPHSLVRRNSSFSVYILFESFVVLFNTGRHLQLLKYFPAACVLKIVLEAYRLIPQTVMKRSTPCITFYPFSFIVVS
jgi:hypothetical protein